LVANLTLACRLNTQHHHLFSHTLVCGTVGYVTHKGLSIRLTLILTSLIVLLYKLKCHLFGLFRYAVLSNYIYLFELLAGTQRPGTVLTFANRHRHLCHPAGRRSTLVDSPHTQTFGLMGASRSSRNRSTARCAWLSCLPASHFYDARLKWSPQTPRHRTRPIIAS
jgi:hypothetical protein